MGKKWHHKAKRLMITADAEAATATACAFGRLSSKNWRTSLKSRLLFAISLRERAMELG